MKHHKHHRPETEKGDNDVINPFLTHASSSASESSSSWWMLALAILTPILAFTGAVLGHRVTRRGDAELDRWRKREETMRMLRWAVELAISEDPRRATAGISALNALLDSPLLDTEDVALVASIAARIASS